MLALAGCDAQPASEASTQGDAASEQASSGAASASSEAAEPSPTEDAAEEPVEELSQAEDCDWDAPRLSAAAEPPEAQEGAPAEVLVGAWQHTHTDEGAGFEAVTNDHRYVFPSPDRML